MPDIKHPNSNSKQTRGFFPRAKGRAGFTLIELIVVLAILGMMLGLVLVNLAGQRIPRNLKIAQNELVSNLRGIQSNTLSARSYNGQSVQYYAIKFDLSKPTQYTLQAIYNVSSSPQVTDIQTVTLPSGIVLSPSTPIVISRSNSPTTQQLSAASGDCGLVAFAAPFGRVFLNDGCSPATLPNNPYTIASGDGDDYQKILNFVTNTNCNGNTPIPFGCTLSVDSSMTITFSDPQNSQSKTVTINGVTGGITFQ